MQKIIGVLSLGVVAIVVAFLWHKSTLPQPIDVAENVEKLSVVTTFYPLEEFARQVGGNRVTVRSIVPAGAEPHDYEPTPQDILSAYQADVFLLNGAGVDTWAEKIRPELEKRGVTVLQMSEFVSLLPDAEKENSFDPHFWLDPILAQKEVEAIHNVFVLRDTDGREIYNQEKDRYIQELKDLDTRYSNAMTTCAVNSIITSHQAFSYMAQRYHFEVIPVTGISPEIEPSPKDVADIVQIMRERKIKYVFFETLLSPKMAETIAQETGAQILVFNPLEGLTEKERQDGENYLTIMNANLENLKTARQCQN